MVTLETELHEAVSMSLADCLRVLLEHGLLNGGEGMGMEGCVSVWGRWGRRKVGGEERDCAAWRVFQYYYSLKVRPHVHHMTSCDFVICHMTLHDFIDITPDSFGITSSSLCVTM